MNTTYSNITFGTFDDICKEKIDLTGYTTVLVISKPEMDKTIKEFADVLLRNGCRDFAFCGVGSDKWHRIFDDVDIKKNRR